MSAVAELFGRSAWSQDENWPDIVDGQQCPFLGKGCYKTRKSNPETAIGTCTVLHGRSRIPVLICPARLLEKGQIFTDCLHLLALHEPGNELHVVSEVQIPGGSVDYFFVSARNDDIADFAGIELQTLDTTGTVWPERQRLLRSLGLPRKDSAENITRGFGMNWKMTAKTTLVQMHHKVRTFENLRKKLVLVLQDVLMNYMIGEFDFAHLRDPASNGHSMHFHVYDIEQRSDNSYGLFLSGRRSTDGDGIAKGLNLQAESHVELSYLIEKLQAKIGPDTLFSPVRLATGRTSGEGRNR